ncbi:hypothetical protein AURANDRAFT_71714, partial [Aureococcus anophagefferens]
MRHALLRLAVVLDCAAALFPFHALKGRVDQSSWITQKTPTAPTGGLFGRRVGGARQAPQRFITPSPAPRPAAEADATSAATSSWVALALLRQELDDMGVAQHEAEAAHTATRQELATALRNATALAADLAKSERLRRLVQREVQQLREVARNATSKALRAESSAKRATSRRPATRGAAMTPENPTAPGWLDAEDALSPEARAARLRERKPREVAARPAATKPPGALSPEARAARLREQSLRTRDSQIRVYKSAAPRRPAAITGTFQRGMTAEEKRTPPPVLESRHAAPPAAKKTRWSPLVPPRAGKARAAAPPAPPAPPAPRWSPLVPPEVFERRETGGGGAARPSDSPPKKKSKKLASGSALYQQLQIAEMEAAAELEAVRR